MALSIGSLIGYLELDDTQFARKADQADRKLRALKLNLDALDQSDPKVKVQVETSTRKIDELLARIEELKAKSAEGIDVKVEMTKAQIELSALESKVRDLTNKEINIKADVNDKAAKAKLDALKAKVDGLNKPQLGMLGVGAILGPAVLPAITATAGGMFAIGSGALAAASGVGVLKLALSGLSSSASAYQAYEAALSVATNPKQRQAALTSLDKSAYGQASPQMQAFTRMYVDTFKPELGKIQSGAQAGLLPGLTTAMRDLVPILPLLARSAREVGQAMGGMAVDAARALNSPFWRQFIEFIGVNAKRDLPILGNIFGNLFEGMARGIERFSPDGTSLLMWVDHLAQKFNKWTSGQGFTEFMDIVKRDSSAVMSFLQASVPLITNLFKGLDTAGATELTLFAGVMKDLSVLPTGAIVTLGEALPAIVLAVKGLQAVGGLSRLGSLLNFGGLGKGGGILGKISGVTGTPVFVTNWPGGFGGHLPGEPGGPGGGPFLGKVGSWFEKHPVAAGSAQGLGIVGAGLTAEEIFRRTIIPQTQKSLLQYQTGLALGMFGGGGGGKVGVQDKNTPLQNQVANAFGNYNIASGLGLLPGYKKSTDIAATFNQWTNQFTANTKQAQQQLHALGVSLDDIHLAGQKPVKVTADTKDAKDKIDGLKKDAGVPLSVSVNADTSLAAAAIARIVQQADGTIIRLPVTAHGAIAKAAGGMVYGAGSATSDSIPAFLSNGEFVVNAAAAARNRALLEAINSNRYASGGRVKGPSVSQIDSNALSQILAWLSTTNGQISAAQQWSSSIAGNPFSASLTGPASTMTMNIGGIPVKVTDPGQAITAASSPKQVLAAMMSYQAGQFKSAHQLLSDIQVLRKKGVSEGVLAQMRSAGAQGEQEIHALALAPADVVRRFNAMQANITSTLDNAGAYAVSGRSFSSLHEQQLNQQNIKKGVQDAIKNGVPVVVIGGPAHAQLHVL